MWMELSNLMPISAMSQKIREDYVRQERPVSFGSQVFNFPKDLGFVCLFVFLQCFYIFLSVICLFGFLFHSYS